MAVEGQIVLEEDPGDMVERRRMHKPQDYSPCHLEEAVNTFKRNSSAKALVKKPFAPIPHFGRADRMNGDTPL